MKQCSLCQHKAVGRGLCNTHYKRFMKHGDPHRVLIQIAKSKIKHGYIVRTYKNKDIIIHRRIIEINLGRELRADEHVHHINGIRNDNRLENLIVLSPSQHKLLHIKEDGHSNSLKTHCPRGHEYAGSNIYLYKGRRDCRECRKRRVLAFKAKALLKAAQVSL